MESLAELSDRVQVDAQPFEWLRTHRRGSLNSEVCPSPTNLRERLCTHLQLLYYPTPPPLNQVSLRC
jgi:hypothetical protein